MSVSTHHLPSPLVAHARPPIAGRPGIGDWLAALLWTGAVAAAHLLMFVLAIALLVLR